MRFKLNQQEQAPEPQGEIIKLWILETVCSELRVVHYIITIMNAAYTKQYTNPVMAKVRDQHSKSCHGKA